MENTGTVGTAKNHLKTLFVASIFEGWSVALNGVTFDAFFTTLF